ncbi:MAG TPA: LamG-like jellyroll fold domain-containing protein [Candidatus Polarisedimenticolaceae bacterium]|nr:LamG-like jellyroll fold domain-containing protein [Candidatus Polarisedimenticolaceae bacterium]
MRNPRGFLGAVVVGILSFGGLRALSACELPPRGLASWLPGDGNTTDLTGASPGTLFNGVAYAPGIDGLAFSFDGVNDRLEIADSPSLRPQRFTLAAWVQLDVAEPDGCIICKQTGSGDADSYSLWISGNVLRGGMFRFAEAVGTTQLPVGRLIHVATTWDGIAIRLYLDGKQIAIAAGPASPPPYDGNPVIVGGEDNGINFYEGFFDGLIDEPQIYGRALSACEIRALYRAGANGACKGDNDGDAILDFQDNCPTAGNGGQVDADADGVGDACDCAPADSHVFANPGDYKGLHFDVQNTASWCAEPAQSGPDTVYDVLRGDLDNLPVATPTSECRSRCSTPPSGLVGWWPGDGSTAGLVGGAGTLENGAGFASGWVRQSFSFDGVDDRVRTAPIALGNTFSVAAWVNSSAVNQGGYRRIVESSYATGFFLGFDVSGTHYKLIVKNGVAPYGSANGGTVLPEEWQLVVGTYDGAIGTLYVDGVPVASDSFAPPGAVNLAVYFGNFSTGGFAWKGLIDEVQVFNRMLTAAEIRTMYEAGSVGQCKSALGGIDAAWTAPWASDLATPAPGHGFWYIFRGRNSCGTGTYGFASTGAERLCTACD